MKIAFTSDSHYGHTNICGPKVSSWKSGFRNFDRVEDMNDAIVNSYNEVLGENDILYHLGDWSFGGVDNISKFRNRIKCKNIILIYGNHDHHIRKSFRHLFKETYDFLERRIGGHLFILNHYAQRVWNKSHHGSLHLYGHSHHSLPDIGGKCFDIGWCGWRRPLLLEEVVEIMNKRDVHTVDHHNSECAE